MAVPGSASYFGMAPPGPTAYWSDVLGDAPLPTEAPNPELVKRLSDPRTCGYEVAFGLYLTCGDGFICLNLGSYRGCCATASGFSECQTNINTACIDYNASLTGACDSIGPQTQCCSASSKGACFTWLFTAMAEPGRTLTEWQCRSTGGFGILVDNPETSTTLAQSQTASSTQKGDPVMDPPDADARTPVGAIIGGVIGSLAVISLGVIGSLLVLRRRQQTAQTFIGGGNRPGLGTAHSQVPLSGYGPHERYMPISTSSGYSPSSSQKYRDMEMNPPYSIELDATPTSHIVELDGTLAIGGHDNRAELKA